MKDICPILSIGKDEPVDCNEYCAWFDTQDRECAVSRINGNLKRLEDLVNAVGSIND